MNEQLGLLSDLLESGRRLSRRELFGHSARFGISASVLAAILASCSNDDEAGDAGSSITAAPTGTLVIANWGGPQDDARKAVIYEQFGEQTSTKIVDAAGAIDYGKVKAMVDAGNLQFDIVNTAPSLFYTLDPSYFEKIDYARNPDLWETVINKTDYTAPEYTGAEALIYRTDAFPSGKAPQSWVDFWNTKDFPGKRALGADGGFPWFTLETAVLGQGLAPDEVYPIDVDLAFSSMDELRATGDLKIWSSTAEAGQMLASGEVVMARTITGIVWDLLDSGELSVSWLNSIAWNETNHILAGTENYDQAMDYLEFLMDPQNQADMSKLSHNGPANAAALDLLDPAIQARLPVPPDSIDSALFQDYQWYGENYDDIVVQWATWQEG